MMKNLSVRGKIFIGFGVILCLLLVVSVITILSVGKISHNSVFVKDVAFRQAIYLIEMEGILRQMKSQIAASVDTGTKEGLENAARLKRSVDTKWSEAEALFAEDESLLAEIQSLEDMVETYFMTGNKLVLLTMDQFWTEVGALTLKYNKHGEDIFARITELKENGIGQLDNALLEIVSQTKKTVTMNSVIVVVAFLVGILLASVIAQMIVRPIKRLMAAASAIAGGDMKGKVDIEGDDEIGSLARSFNHMSQSLRQMLNKVHSTFRSLDDVSRQLSRISGDISQGSNQTTKAVEDAYNAVDKINQTTHNISASMQQFSNTHEQTNSWIVQMASSISELANNSEMLASSVDETTSSVHQMSVSINQVSDNVGALLQMQTSSSSSIMEIGSSIKEVENKTHTSSALAEKVNKIVKERGGSSVENAVKGIKVIREKVNHTSKIIEHLGSNIENINQIVTVINEIADQTKLLSLNASILSAQAGEHGKGFSVVADEISNLSESTINSTKEIEELIGSILAESKTAMKAMIEGSQVTDEGVSLIQNVQDALNEIYEGVVSSYEISKEISRSTIEQGRSANLVNKSIVDVTEMCESINKATFEQKDGANLIVRAAVNMRDVSAVLKKTAQEQSQGSRRISHSMGEMVSSSRVILDAIVKNRDDTELLASSIGDIHDIYGKNLDAVSQMDTTVNVLSQQAKLLQEEINKFSF